MQKLGNVRVMRLMGMYIESDLNKNTLCATLDAMLEEDAAILQGVEVVLSEAEVIFGAYIQLKVAVWYARWWYLDMAENGWMTSGGVQVNARNWRRLL